MYRDFNFTSVLQMSIAFQHRVLCPSDAFQDPLLLLSLSSAQPEPALVHAWLASSMISLMPRESTMYHRKALLHHNQALRGLRDKINDINTPQSEWQRATILMLHIFEVRRRVSNP
jgi:hypothetical protein